MSSIEANIDKLAAGGLRFTQFHNTARCCPPAPLIALYPHQAGIGHMMEDDDLPGYRRRSRRESARKPSLNA